MGKHRIELVNRSCGGKLKVKSAERWFACVFLDDALVYTTRRFEHRRHAKSDAELWIEQLSRPSLKPEPPKLMLVGSKPTVRNQIRCLSDADLVAAAVRIAGSTVFAELRLSRWQREFLVGLPKHFQERSSISWGQRSAMRMMIEGVIEQLHARRFVAELREETAHEVEGVLDQLVRA